MRKIAAAAMMVNVDEKLAFEPFEAGALDIVALEYDRSVITSIHGRCVNHSPREG